MINTSHSDVVELERRFAETPLDCLEPDVIFEDRPHIQPGEYELELDSHRFLDTQWGSKLVLNFAVVGGESNSIILPRFYNAGKDARGRPKVAPGSDFRREMKLLFAGRDFNRFAFKWFHDVIVIGTVVDTGNLPDIYSKVAALHGVITK